ncbi:MAG: TRAP transporter small permease [Pseudomonadota bacterium]|nr:TRAP transporter small permease [Pseudomonadota bacterium]
MERLGRLTAGLEEGLVTLCLGLMTVITFANVIARYVFNSNILWALEATVYLFAWMVLIGTSYLVRINAHLGVDALVGRTPAGLRRILTLVSVACCIAFAALLLKGGWDYWYRFASVAAFMEVNDTPMPAFLQFIADWMNDGEEYEKLPRFIPYFALPFGMALLLFRFLQAAWQVVTGQRTLIIVSHEAEDMVEAAAAETRAADAARGGRH